MQVLENSPAHRAGLEAYFDFIVSIDGIRLVSVYNYYDVRRGAGDVSNNQPIAIMCVHSVELWHLALRQLPVFCIFGLSH